jgi:branched-chain amino acid transport system substrate-binding protein
MMPAQSIVALGVAALALGSADVERAQRGPIRIGFLLPQTGPLAANGKDMQNGLQLFLDEQNHKLGGREVQLFVEDSAGVPATGLAKTRSLVEGQDIHILVGPLSAAVGYAIAPYVTERKVPAVFPIVSAEDLTQRKRSPYIVRTGWTSAQPMHPFGRWVYENLKYKKIAVVGFDYAFGWETAAGFLRAFEEAGGHVVQKLWSPLGTADYGPYLAQLRRDVDAVFAVFAGADALRFVKQYADAGLKGRLPLIGGGTLTDEHVLRTMGDESIGIVSALHYSAALDDPNNRKFVQAYEAKFKQVPSYYAMESYVAGQVLKQAIEMINGDVEQKEKLLAALRKTDVPNAPHGRLKLDGYGNPIQNIYIRKVEKVNGRLQNTVIHTFPSVSQFWTYDPEEFLKKPVYNRDYPPCRSCGK